MAIAGSTFESLPLKLTKAAREAAFPFSGAVLWLSLPCSFLPPSRPLPRPRRSSFAGIRPNAKETMMSVIHLNQVELAARWKISPRTLERWRWTGEGPAFTAWPESIRQLFAPARTVRTGKPSFRFVPNGSTA
jgi:hypothetical protein